MAKLTLLSLSLSNSHSALSAIKRSSFSMLFSSWVLVSLVAFLASPSARFLLYRQLVCAASSVCSLPPVRAFAADVYSRSLAFARAQLFASGTTATFSNGAQRPLLELVMKPADELQLVCVCVCVCFQRRLELLGQLSSSNYLWRNAFA